MGRCFSFMQIWLGICFSFGLLIYATFFLGISAVIVLPSYWLICYCIEKYFRKKNKIQVWCRYRLNRYFIIKKKYRGKPHIYMNMTLPLTLINWCYCIRKRRYAILKEFSHALTDLKSELPIWFDKCNEDLYFTTNSKIMKKIMEAEQAKILRIKNVIKINKSKQHIERKSICNPDKDDIEMFEIVIIPYERK